MTTQSGLLSVELASSSGSAQANEASLYRDQNGHFIEPLRSAWKLAEPKMILVLSLESHMVDLSR